MRSVPDWKRVTSAVDAGAGRWSVHVGRVGAAPVVVHASWFVAFGLMTGVLAGEIFPMHSPGWAPAMYWAVAIVTTVLLFASLMLHELAHCWVARRRGLVVQRVTLFVFGSVAEIDREPASPGTALRIALAGPLTSLSLAMASAAVGWLAREVGVVAAAATILARLNVMLGLFNLLPGHPLDGGRVLHAAVWLATGDRARATAVSTRAGRWVSLGIVTLGVVLLLQGAFVGLWLVIIGWFQHASAVAAAESAPLEAGAAPRRETVAR